MVKFRCRNCNYQFNSEIDATKKMCPNCGNKTINKEQTAEELLMDSFE